MIFVLTELTNLCVYCPVSVCKVYPPPSSMFCHMCFITHDDVIKWKHFPRNWPFVRGIHRSPMNSPHKGQWRRALMFSLICVWINGWVNYREAGDLRRYLAHYVVTVMQSLHNQLNQHSYHLLYGDDCHLCGEFTGPRWIPRTKASDAEL